MLRRVLISTVALALLCSGRAYAQSPLEPGTWTVSPLIGLTLDEDADPSLSLTGIFGFPLNNMFAIEGEIGHVFDMASDDPNVDSSLTTVHGGITAFFESDFVMTPYLAAGIGLGKFSHKVAGPPADINTTELGFNLGGGITYQIDDPVWFRFDFRYFKHIDDVPSTWRFAAGVTLRIGE